MQILSVERESWGFSFFFFEKFLFRLTQYYYPDFLENNLFFFLTVFQGVKDEFIKKKKKKPRI